MRECSFTELGEQPWGDVSSYRLVDDDLRPAHNELSAVVTTIGLYCSRRLGILPLCIECIILRSLN